MPVAYELSYLQHHILEGVKLQETADNAIVAEAHRVPGIFFRMVVKLRTSGAELQTLNLSLNRFRESRVLN